MKYEGRTSHRILKSSMYPLELFFASVACVIIDGTTPTQYPIHYAIESASWGCLRQG